ncbi:MAG: alpha/beta hydrolase [Alphaproteobacteria bacterium]|nr:alpha/beta hydrolase [Alphaproteobacteria bacterium]
MQNPCPAGARVQWLVSRDQVRLRAMAWAGDGAPSNIGSILVLQGRTECIEKYFETIGELRGRGFAVGAFDWRGQGLSDRSLDDNHKGHVKDFSEYHHDLDAFLDQCVLPGLLPPYTLLAHSMGAHIALRYLHDRPQPFARAVLCSPMAYVNTAPLPHFAARAIVKIGAALGCSGHYVPGGRDYSRAHELFSNDPLTSDRGRFERNADILENNPDLALGSPTVAWLDAAYRSMKMVLDPEFCKDIVTPALLFYGTEERVSLPEYQKLLAERLAGCEAVCINGARHEILQETNAVRAQFWAAFDRFMKNPSD